MSDVKKITVRELNRQTARIVSAVVKGETFELQRNGIAVCYLSRALPPLPRGPDWTAHFERLRRKHREDGAFAEELEEDRRRQRLREEALG